MCKLLYITTATDIENGVLDGGDFWAEVNSYLSPEIKKILKPKESERVYTIFCGGRCVCKSFSDRLTKKDFHESLRAQNKMDYNLLLRKKIVEIDTLAIITKLYLCETDDRIFLTKEITANNIDNALSEWQGSCLYKIKRSYADYRRCQRKIY
jgi:hypothetical protein